MNHSHHSGSGQASAQSRHAIEHAHHSVERVTPAAIPADGEREARAPMGHSLDPQPAPEHDAASQPGMRHGQVNHGKTQHGGGHHGGTAHDMSDPAMTAAMKSDMRHRCGVALLPTIPTVLISRVGRDRVACVVPGRRLSETRLNNWVQVAATVPVFQGFAVGRTIWKEALEAFGMERSGEQASRQIVHRYSNWIATCAAARRDSPASA